MKKIVLLLLVGMLLLSCNMNQSSDFKDGTLEFKLPGEKSRSLASTELWYQCQFKLIITDKSNLTNTEEFGAAGENITVEGLRVGTYNLTLEAYKDSKLLCLGETDVTILANQTVYAYIDLNYETGNVNIGINTPATAYTPVTTFSPYTPPRYYSSYSPSFAYSPSRYYSSVNVFTPPSRYSGVRGEAGGFIFYDKGYSSDGWRYMEVAPNDTWSPWGRDHNISSAREESIGFGINNTSAIVNVHNSDTRKGSYGDSINSAALIVDSFSYNGYYDWFMPSLNELKEIYWNLKDVSEANIYRYSRYWSSTEVNNTHAATLYFDNGTVTAWDKDQSCTIRPIRRY